MTAAPALTVRGAADLINAVPYLLGFHPVDSLVVVGMADGNIVVTIRVDLEAAVADPDSVARSIAAMWRGGATRYLGLVFDDAAVPCSGDDLLRWGGVVADLLTTVNHLSGELGDVLLVADQRYWSYQCHGSGCCPDEGQVVAPAASEVPARATYAGMVALPDRRAVERLLDPAPDEIRQALLQPVKTTIDAARDEAVYGDARRLDRSDVRAVFAAARDVASGDLGLDQVDVVRFAAALMRIDVRDSVWIAIDDARLPDDDLWRHLARVLPAPYSAPPLFLIGWAAWRRGHGALALIAAERALEADPTYSAADLLLAALTNGVDPRSMPKVRRPARKYGR